MSKRNFFNTPKATVKIIDLSNEDEGFIVRVSNDAFDDYYTDDREDAECEAESYVDSLEYDGYVVEKLGFE